MLVIRGDSSHLGQIRSSQFCRCDMTSLSTSMAPHWWYELGWSESSYGWDNCSTLRLKALLHFKLLKPYSRMQTIFGWNVRAHNENQWEAPDFGHWTGVSVTASFQKRKNSHCLMTPSDIIDWEVIFSEKLLVIEVSEVKMVIQFGCLVKRSLLGCYDYYSE
jgi:hypothetical protein